MKRHPPPTASAGDRDDEERLRALFEEAGPRPAMPAEEWTALTAAAHTAWQRLLVEHREGGRSARALGRWWPALAAAGLLVALGLAGWWWPARGPAPVVATIEAVRGESWREPAPADAGAGASVGERLGAGTRLETGAGAAASRLALRLSAGPSLRLDAGTAIRLLSATRVALERGAVYVDSGATRAGPARLEIATPLGTVRELGTQFEVRLDPGEREVLAVSVREGAISLTLGAGPHTVAAGERLALAGDGALSRSAVGADDPSWQWILAAAPMLRIEGRSLRDYLDWVCRESGWRLRFADPALEDAAATILLHGTIEGLRPDESVAVVLAGAGLTHRLERGTLAIDRGPARTAR